MSISCDLYNAPPEHARMNEWEKDESFPIGTPSEVMQKIMKLYPRIKRWEKNENIYASPLWDYPVGYHALGENNCSIENEYLDLGLSEKSDGYIHFIGVRKGSPKVVRELLEALKLQYVFEMQSCRLIDPYKYRGNWELIIEDNELTKEQQEERNRLLEEGPINKADGSNRWYDEEGQLHRDNDKPAFIDVWGTQMWYQHGEIHRENGPAVIRSDGLEEWYKNGVKHRDNDLPAIIETNGTKEWCKNGKLHRENDKPAIIHADGSKYWYKNGKLYREDGPVIVKADGTQYWLIDNEMLHEKEYYRRMKNKSK